MPTSVEPKVYIVAYTTADKVGMSDYLASVDPMLAYWPYEVERNSDNNDDIAELTEFMGRLCYRSWAPGLNPNVTKIRESQEAYIKNIIDVNHGSVLEHGVISFVFANVSRVFTHELCRHRVGVAISQESMRYVRLTDIPFWKPTAINQSSDDIKDEFEDDSQSLLLAMETFQQKWSNKLELNNAISFDYKKQMTSALRRWSPQGVATVIGWSCNIRELRHVIKMRTSASAEEEIRLVFDEVAQQVIARWPAMFKDLTKQEDGSYK